jgi:hypothetical protein
MCALIALAMFIAKIVQEKLPSSWKIETISICILVIFSGILNLFFQTINIININKKIFIKQLLFILMVIFFLTLLMGILVVAATFIAELVQKKLRSSWEFQYVFACTLVILYGILFMLYNKVINRIKRAQYTNHIERIITSDSSLVRELNGGRVAFWDSSTQTVVIRNSRGDKGTVFRPTEGIEYFLTKLK